MEKRRHSLEMECTHDREKACDRRGKACKTARGRKEKGCIRKGNHAQGREGTSKKDRWKAQPIDRKC